MGDLEDVEWSPNSFDHLQIPEDKREILLSLTSSRLQNDEEVIFDDFIEGKGLGLSVLF